ncbi:hypothetical protein GCM10028804_48560 [Larkinella terrae]
MQLTACSFAINSGNLASYTAVSGPDQDIAGKTRVYDGFIDRGASEFQGGSDALFFINPAPMSFTICATPTGHSYSSTQQVIGLGGKGPVTYQFYKDGVKYDEYTTNGDASAFVYNSDMASGEYRMVVSNACGGSITSEPLNLTVIPHPTVTILASATAVCAGQSVTLTASGGGTYLWNTTETTAAISVTATGNYKVKVTNENGCFEEKEISITVNSLPSASVTPSSPTVCAGQSVTLTASGGVSYLWDTGAMTASINECNGQSTLFRHRDQCQQLLQYGFGYCDRRSVNPGPDARQQSGGYRSGNTDGSSEHGGFADRRWLRWYAGLDRSRIARRFTGFRANFHHRNVCLFRVLPAGKLHEPDGFLHRHRHTGPDGDWQLRRFSVRRRLQQLPGLGLGPQQTQYGFLG